MSVENVMKEMCILLLLQVRTVAQISVEKLFKKMLENYR